ncbi:MAG: hypothetical protein QOH67_4912, partial [Hyphomicrobiales bacterium]|nr:hypothetical protein [Hyphomicrobiales bacterium]
TLRLFLNAEMKGLNAAKLHKPPFRLLR